ncbi:hypothetical protein G7085_12815 [Tessaracoccus sp. HDW20]|uniref:hypothetical protein n=1 Tax=Tessaracoccus coleopterorum TaxID=2714950 RepID=UPI0018D44729|nr:hypothetical protein [Tessaracoccus coleopterorum]NHB85207.1 hypothetical protein [Tessaracoccus coleopterorum]
MLGIHSPSKVFATIGTQTGQGLINGLLGQAGAIASASSRMVDAAVPSTAPQIPVELAYSHTGSGNPRTNESPTYQINLTVEGALDKDATARTIIDVLNRYMRRTGAIALNGLAL